MSRGGRSRQGPDAATPYLPALPLCGVSKKNETNTTGPTLLGTTAPKPGQIRNPRSVMSPRRGLCVVFFDIRITDISALPGLRQLPGTGSTKLLQTGTATTWPLRKQSRRIHDRKCPAEAGHDKVPTQQHLTHWHSRFAASAKKNETNTTGPTLLGTIAPKPGQIRNPRSEIRDFAPNGALGRVF